MKDSAHGKKTVPILAAACNRRARAMLAQILLYDTDANTTDITLPIMDPVPADGHGGRCGHDDAKNRSKK